MILRPQQIMLYRLGKNPTMANGGGGGGSTSSAQQTSTNTALTNTATSTDTRSVASDQAIATGGNGNTITKNTTDLLTSNSGNTANTANSGNTTSSIANSGNTSNSSSNSTVNTTTDFGAVQAALSGMQTTAGLAMTDSSAITSQAINGLNVQSQNSAQLLNALFTSNATSSANSQGTAMDALGLSSNQTAQASAAVAGAEKSKNEIVGIGAAVVVLIVYLMRTK